MTRKQILEIVEAEPKLKQYHLLNEILGDTIDPWFQGVVRSIRNYQPNTKLLVLCGKETVVRGFFDKLLPLELPFRASTNINEDMLYNQMIVDFPMRERLLKYIQEYNFKVQLPVDKRMCSYCTTWNTTWRFPKRKNVIVCKTEKIDWELYNSIDKLDLWREIFKKF